MSVQSLLEHPLLGLRRAEQIQGCPRSCEGASKAECDEEKALSWLVEGGVHEWFYPSAWDGPGAVSRGGDWHGPLTLLAALVHRRCRYVKQVQTIWIGRKCWPTLQLLYAVLSEHGRYSVERVLSRCLFLDPLSVDERCWAMSQALRCPGIAVVVADGSGLNTVMSRRVQLAAEAGRGLGLLARPQWEESEASWAASRWRVHALYSDSMQPRWAMELVSSKRQPGREVPRRWIVNWSYEVTYGSGALHLSPAVGSGMDSAQETRGKAPDARIA